jgi:hypothetical protein
MADLKISQLTSATALAGTEVVPVVQGGSTKKATIDQILSPAAGKGIDFSANGGDVLNQYDKGVWTPTILGDSGSGVAYVTQSGRYIKIGQLVYVTFHIQLSSKGTISGEARMGGLPFTVVNAGVPARGPLSISIWENLAAAKAWVALYTLGNSTTAYFVASGGAVTSSENAMNTSAISDTSVFVGSGVYEASA